MVAVVAIAVLVATFTAGAPASADADADSSPVTLSGVVRDAQGAPLDGWTVWDGGSGVAVTAPDGTYSLSAAPATWSLHVAHAPSNPVDPANAFEEIVVTSIDMAADRVEDLTVPTVVLSVAVEDDTAAAVAGATVAVSEIGDRDSAPAAVGVIGRLYAGGPAVSGYWPSQSSLTDSGGASEFRLLATSDTAATVDVVPPVGSGLAEESLAGVSVAVDNAVAVVLEPLPPPPPPPPVPATLSGFVHDSQGNPLAGWTVWSGSVYGIRSLAVTDVDGSYSLTDMTGTWSLHVTKADTPTNIFTTQETVRTTIVVTGDQTVDLTVPTVLVDVFVTDEEGTPMPGAEVRVDTLPSNAPSQRVEVLGEVYPGSPAGWGYSYGKTVVADGAGRATLRMLATHSSARFSASPPAGVDLRDGSMSVSLATDAAITIVLPPPLPPPPPPVTLSGVLRDGQGNPLEGWTVWNISQLGVTGPDGSFAVTDQPGDWTLIVVRSDGPFDPFGSGFEQFVWASDRVAMNADTVLDLTIPTVMLDVVVTDEAAVPVADAEIRGGALGSPGTFGAFVPVVGELFPGSGPVRGVWPALTATAGADGTSSFQVLASTETTWVSAEPPAGLGLATGTVSGVDVSADNSVTIVLAPPPPPPPPPVTLSGFARDSQGNPLEGWWVTNLAESVEVSGDGSFALTVDPGLWTLAVAKTETPSDLWSWENAVLLNNSVEVLVDTTLDLVVPTVVIETEVADPTGSPVGGAGVHSDALSSVSHGELVAVLGELFPGSGPMLGLWSSQQATTGTNGSAELTMLATAVQTATITASPPAGAGLRAASLAGVPLDADLTVAITLPETPHVTLASPPDGAVVVVGQEVPIEFSCAAGSAPLVSCDGDLPPGAFLDTSIAGHFSFTVSSADTAGGTTTVTHDYVVHDPPKLIPGVATVTEQDTGTITVEVPVTLSASTLVPVTADWTTVDFSAASPGDFTAAAGTVTFAAGETTATATVTVVSDLAHEDDELFWVGFSNLTNATLGGFYGLGAVVIADNDPIPVVAPAGVTTHPEGDIATTTAFVPVTLSNPSASTVTVDWATHDWTATSGQDYIAASGTVAFAPGDTTATIAIAINGDTVDEPDELLVVALSNPQRARVGGFYGLGFVTLTDDDP